MRVREKTSFFKKSTFSDRLEMFFFWRPISKLVDSQFFRKLGHSLADWHRFKVRVWARNGHFFYWRPFLLKIVPFSQFLTKTIDSKTHFRAFFMLYTNQLTKKKLKFFWPYLTKKQLAHGDVMCPKVKIFSILFSCMNFFLNYIFLKNNSCRLGNKNKNE